MCWDFLKIPVLVKIGKKPKKISRTIKNYYQKVIFESYTKPIKLIFQQ